MSSANSVNIYSMYVLSVLLVAYMLSHLDRFMLAITAEPMAQDIHFGDKACLLNSSFYTKADLDYRECNETTKKLCHDISANDSRHVCKWDFNGQGYEYQLVAGPVFTLVYTLSGIFIGYASDIFNRKMLLAACLIFWSTTTLCTGFIDSYWQLVTLRVGLGIGEAGGTPLAASLIADYFIEATRGMALGVFLSGSYIGYSLSFTLGNAITVADILGQGWRWAYYISGIPGVLLGVVILLSLKEPRSSDSNRGSIRQEGPTDLCYRITRTIRPFMSPSLSMICISASLSNGAGYVWSYNAQSYFTAMRQSPEQISSYMSWIPLVGGSLGVVIGGFFSDRIVKGRGLYARVFVTFASQVLVVPFAAGTLYLEPPWAYIMQIPTCFLGEMWAGVTLAVVVELVPVKIRTGALGMYQFINTNIAGTVAMLLPSIQQGFEADGYTKAQALRGALYILWPGMFIGGSLFSLLTVIMLKREELTAQQKEYQPLASNTDHHDS